MVKACLFDLDGVVFDTEPLYTLFWKEIGEQFCPNVPNFEYVIKGQTLVQIYDKYFEGQNEKQKEITRLLDLYERDMDYNYVAGFKSFIKNIRSKDLKRQSLRVLTLKRCRMFIKSIQISNVISMLYLLQKILMKVNLLLIVILKLQLTLIFPQKIVWYLKIVSMACALELLLVPVW